MSSVHEVKITQNSGEAAQYHANHIPYIVWLNEGNREQTFPNGAYCVENLSDVDEEYLERVYRRFKGIPWDIAETSRLKIREIKVEDVARLYELYRDESITRYMEPLFQDIGQETAYTKAYIENVYGFYGYGMWVMENKESGQVIGRAGLEYKEGFEGLELGFMLGVDYQHKGYAYEACSAILRYGIGELGQNKYYAWIDEDNAASIRLCRRLGFTKKDVVKYGGAAAGKEYAQYVYTV